MGYPYDCPRCDRHNTRDDARAEYTEPPVEWMAHYYVVACQGCGLRVNMSSEWYLQGMQAEGPILVRGVEDGGLICRWQGADNAELFVVHTPEGRMFGMEMAVLPWCNVPVVPLLGTSFL